jgi:hypothetical protein
MEIYRTNQVFVPGGIPTLTYVPRSDRNLEEQLKAANDNLCKLVTVTGSTKSGKTVLTNRVFPRTSSVWINGGTVKEEEDLWNFILEQTGGYSESSASKESETTAILSGEISASGQLPLILKGGTKFGAGYEKKRGDATEKKLALNPRAAAISQPFLASPVLPVLRLRESHSSVRSEIFVARPPIGISSPVGAKYAAPDGA